MGLVMTKLVYLSQCHTVVALVRRSGRCDAKIFIEDLELRHKARFQRLIERLAQDASLLKNPEHYRILNKRDKDGTRVSELKTNKYRLYLVEYEGYYYATHGREKPKDSRVPDEVNKALEFYRNWRTGGG